MTRSAVIALLLACGALLVAADQTLPPLRERPYATVITVNGSKMIGAILERGDDGLVVFQEAGRDRPQRLQADEYTQIIESQSATDVVAERTAIILADGDRDWSVDMLRTIRWALEQDISESALELALAAAQRHPGDQRLIEAVIEILSQVPGQDQALERVLRAGLEANTSWSEGFEFLVDHLAAQDRDEDAAAVIQAWLKRHPGDHRANLLVARASEAAGDLDEAKEAYRKAYTLYQDLDAGAGYARLCLRTGDLDAAAQAAEALAGAGENPHLAEAVLGVVAVHREEDEAARGYFEGLDRSVLPPDLLRLVRYHHGLVAYRAGDVDRALEQWRGLDAPVARMARSMASGETAALEGLDESHRRLAKLHNAALALARRDHEAALAALDGLVGDRAQFLRQLSEVLASITDDQAVDLLDRYDGLDAQRWQVYTHLLGQRFERAGAIASRLPADDDFALASRIYLAEVREQSELAASLFWKLTADERRTDGSVPPEHISRLAAIFEATDNRKRIYDFDWPEGYNLAHGWRSQARGTGIAVVIEDGRLVFTGTQTAAPEPITRAWCLVPADRLHRAELTIDIREVGQATVGLELLTEDLATGIAYGIDPKGDLVWRRRREGRWDREWNDGLDLSVQGGSVTLTIEYHHSYGRILITADDQSRDIGDDPLAGPYLVVGAFGTAAPGETWRLAAEALAVELKGEDGVAPRRRSTGGHDRDGRGGR